MRTMEVSRKITFRNSLKRSIIRKMTNFFLYFMYMIELKRNYLSAFAYYKTFSIGFRLISAAANKDN